MKYAQGYWIKRARLEQNLSQESLCKGICVVSYLSKIENGLVQANPELLDRLFEALHIRYTRDEALLAPLRVQLRACFERFFHSEAIRDPQLEQHKETLLYSELSLLYLLYQCFCIEAEESNEPQAPLLSSLRALQYHMDESEIFLYQVLLALSLPALPDRLHAVERARRILPCSATSVLAAQLLYKNGHYQEALLHCVQGYAYATAEGMHCNMLEASHLEALCYANLFEHDLMLRAFSRTRELARGDNGFLSQIDYNIGASLMEKAKHEEALSYLLSSQRLWPKQEDRFWLCHKLALCYQALGQAAQGMSYLEEAKAVAAASADEIRLQLIRVVELRYTDDYLESDEYFTLLQALCEQDNALHHGYRQFHALMLMDAFKHRRRYKEALALVARLHPSFF